MLRTLQVAIVVTKAILIAGSPTTSAETAMLSMYLGQAEDPNGQIGYAREIRLVLSPTVESVALQVPGDSNYRILSGSSGVYDFFEGVSSLGATAGIYRFKLTNYGSETIYQTTLDSITASEFVDLPSVLSPQAGQPTGFSHTFAWQPPLDVDRADWLYTYCHVLASSGTNFFRYGWSGSDPGPPDHDDLSIDATNWAISNMPAGDGLIAVNYNVDCAHSLSPMAWVSGPDWTTWGSQSLILVSHDEQSFVVIPEPTMFSLFMLGTLAIRQRKPSHSRAKHQRCRS